MNIKLSILLLIIFFFTNTNAQKSLYFDGTDAFVLGTNNTSLDLTQGTIEAWIKTSDAGTGWRAIVNKQGSYGIYLYNNTIALWDMGDWEAVYTSIDLADNTWHHVAFSFNDNVVDGTKLFVDGLPVLTTTIGTPIQLKNIIIGATQGSSSYIQHFKGNIDQVRVWNSVRTEAEIKTNYKNCLIGNETGLVMLFNFDEGTGTVANDSSGNNNNGTLMNMDTATDWVSGYQCINLVAYYPFNGNANDESGNGNHGTVSGATLTTDRFGNENSAYQFNSNDIITISDSSVLNIDGELSISVWVKPTTLTDAMILGKSNYISKTNYLLRTKSTGFLQFEYKNYANSTNNPLIAGQWNHIVVISELDNTKRVYVNNILSSHTTATSPYGLVPNDLTIGARSTSASGEHFNGIIDDLRIYKSVLSESEINSLFINNTLKIEKIDNIESSNFYVSNNSIYFKNSQNLKEVKKIEVYNLLSQKIFTTSKIKENIKLNNIQKGIYILKVEYTNKNYSTLKFIID